MSINPAFFFTDYETIFLANQGYEGISLDYDAPMHPIFASLHSDQSGASIVLLAGLSEQGADFHGYADLIKHYLSPANPRS